MLFAVRYEAGSKFKGHRMVNAVDHPHAIQKVRTRLREELPVETSAHEVYEIMLPGEPLEV